MRIPVPLVEVENECRSQWVPYFPCIDIKAEDELPLPRAVVVNPWHMCRSLLFPWEAPKGMLRHCRREYSRDPNLVLLLLCGLYFDSLCVTDLTGASLFTRLLVLQSSACWTPGLLES